MGFATDADCYGIPSSTPTTCIPRVAAILEGGYSDAALMSGTASLLQGLSAREDENWFENQLEVKDIGLLEKASCINPPPPTVAKKLPAWALTAGQQLCHFLGEDREEWAKSQAKRAEIEARAAAAEPRALRERKGPKTYVEDEVDDTERPPPPTKPAQKPTKQRTPQPTPKPPKSKSEAPPAHAKAVEPVVVSQISLRGDSSMDQILNQAEAARKAATAVHSTSVFSQPPQRSSPQPQAQSPPPVQSSHFPAFEGEAPPPSPPARPSQEQQQPSRPPVREPKPLSAHEEARLEAARNQDGGIWANPFPSSAPSPPKKPTATPRGSLHASGASSAASAAPAPGQSEPRRRLNIISPTGSRESAMDQFASAVGRSWTQQEQDVFNPTFRTLGRQQQPQPQSRSQQSQPGSQSGGGVKFTFQGAPLRDPSQFGPWTPSDQ